MLMSTTISVLRFAASLLRARLDGSYKRTPFFTPDGIPVVEPRVLATVERERVMYAVSQF